HPWLGHRPPRRGVAAGGLLGGAAGARAGASRARPGRSPRAGRGPSSIGDRRRRRTPPPDVGTAGRRQDDARPLPAGPAAAPGAGSRGGHAVRRVGSLPGPLPAGGGDQSVPLRLGRRRREALPVFAYGGGRLSERADRTAAGPDRPPGLRASSGTGDARSRI